MSTMCASEAHGPTATLFLLVQAGYDFLPVPQSAAQSPIRGASSAAHAAPLQARTLLKPTALFVVVSGLSLSEAMVQVVLSSGYVQHKEQQHAKKAAKASKQSDAGKERQAEAEGAGQQEGTKRDGSSSHAQQEVGVKRKRPGWMLDEDEEEEGNELQ
eukprot:scaffold67286_cov14-Tisochrysis_lutea.AAC.1